ncbi:MULTISPECIES: filamentous hemagglutinin N-terminal domain-containing protein [Leptolyngbya]|uniref:two-partner secretion domain-containing protein n=1 Tax=Leptolyngbya TaxID=47251 RepID=UPI00168276B3|nr:filamentous hemagglutinin N-terminal domain-containing protein [Leptolyngbya sp. FACHB-1624]MBD1857956.1 filamentous hemagglutinin N-terminal domain-containing protein [Leptolyngbya sp. FACHB-1624]
MNRVLVWFGFVSLSAVISVESAIAQVIPDGSLPTSVTSPNNLNFTIDGGTRNGNNLFHSFGQFSIPTGGSALFNNATDIQNIFSRVTGGTVSNIDGLIQANGSANLFLLNPNGILFGSNASLNIGGSFLGSTANSIKFADGTEFSAGNPTSPPLLTMSAPIGLQMGQNPGAIVNHAQGAPGYQGYPIGLRVPNQTTLALLGGEILLDQGNLRATEGHIELGSVAGKSYVGLKASGNRWSFDYGQVTGFNDITVQRSMIDVNGNGAGGIYVAGRNITIQEGGRLMARNLPGSTQNARDDIKIQGSQSIVLQSGFVFPGSGCTVQICGSLISNTTQGQGNAGTVVMTAPNIQMLDGGQVVLGARGTGASGIGGKAVIQADTLDIVGISKLANFASGISGWMTNGASGQGGDVVVNAGRLRVLNGGSISVSSRSSFGSLVQSENATSTAGAGNLEINVRESVEVSGVGIASTGVISPSTLDASVFSDAKGRGGNIRINTDRLLISDGARISTSIDAAQASGNAGKLEIRAREANISGNFSPNLRSEIIATSSGQVAAGSINMKVDRLTVENSGRVSVSSTGSGDAGNISIDAKQILLKNQGTLQANTNLGGEGNITIASNALILRSGSSITTNSGSNVSGGNININSDVIVGLGNSDIVANAVKGRGGDITLTTQGLIGLVFRNTLTPQADPTNDITASSEFNVNGTVRINNIGIDPNAGLVELSQTLIDNNQQVAAGCSSNQGSRFVMTGRGGIPMNPMEHTPRDRTWADLRSISPAQTRSLAQSPQSPVLVEARDWRRNPQTGKVELIAARPASLAQQVTCSQMSDLIQYRSEEQLVATIE